MVNYFLLWRSCPELDSGSGQRRGGKRLFYILLLINYSLFAQVQFDAKVSKTSLGLNERIRIDFSMNADGDNFIPPNFESCGFKVVSGPSQMVSQSWINGRSTFNKAYSYTLMPMKKGSLIIKQASIEINGQNYKTTPLKITVTDAVDLPKDPNQEPSVRSIRWVQLK